MKYIYNISENNGYKENIKIGKKAQNLNDLLKNGFNVPYFFVISTGGQYEIYLRYFRK